MGAAHRDVSCVHLRAGFPDRSSSFRADLGIWGGKRVRGAAGRRAWLLQSKAFTYECAGTGRRAHPALFSSKFWVRSFNHLPAGCGSSSRSTARRIRDVVEWPLASGTRRTRPPAARTVSAPTTCSIAQSAPLTSRSGCSAAIVSAGVSSSNTTTRSTALNAPRIQALERSSCTGRVSPLRRLTDASLLIATISLSHSAAALFSKEMCPGWSKS